MDKEVLKVLTKRFADVDRRLIAIKKEELILEREHTSLSELLEIYEEEEYDSIEEERRVTDGYMRDKPISSPYINDVSKMPVQTKKNDNRWIRARGKSKYDDIMEIVFEGGVMLYNREISEKVNMLIDKPVAQATIFGIMKNAIKYGKAERIGDQYRWLGKGEDTDVQTGSME